MIDATNERLWIAVQEALNYLDREDAPRGDWYRVRPEDVRRFREALAVNGERTATLQEERDEARSKLAACLKFMVTEMHWEEFRAEMLYHDDVKKQNTSEENARKLHNFLVGIKA
jgi:hypothetical protein